MTDLHQHESITTWVEHLRSGDARAASFLHDRYRADLLRSMRERFPSAMTAAGDEDDLIQSVFCELWTIACGGNLHSVDGRDSFWWFLWTIARNKAVSRIRAANAAKRRGRGRILQFSQVNDSENVIGETVDPHAMPADLIQEFLDQQERLIQLLEGMEKDVAFFKIEGYKHPSIAAKLGVTVRTVERKVAIIREKWLRYQNAFDEGLDQNDTKGD